MKRLVVALACLIAFARPASAHVGSPDVFYEGDAGPYHLFVAVRSPGVIPGVATIEIRTSADDVRAVSVVPLRLTGPGSELPPTPDRAERSAGDPKFFTAALWLMEYGSLQVRITVDGARGQGKLAIPVPATALRTLTMDRWLGGLLLGLMVLLALALVSILAGAVRESALEPGAQPAARERRRTRIATALVGGSVIALLGFGNWWWNAEATDYEEMIAKPWVMKPRVDGCRLALPGIDINLLPDHGHDLHLFMVRVPDLDRLAHLHPHREADGTFVQGLPSLPAGHYAVFADIVLETGFPITGTGDVELPELTCAPPSGDDAMWSGTARAERDSTVAELAGGGHMRWDRPPALHASVALPLRFHVDNADGSPAELDTYMGMAGHAAVMRIDRGVFAHLHPSGSVAMPALALAQQGIGVTNPHAGHEMHHLPPDVVFPYGFPQPGWYRIFVQVKRAGMIETAAFDAHVEP